MAINKWTPLGLQIVWKYQTPLASDYLGTYLWNTISPGLTRPIPDDTADTLYLELTSPGLKLTVRDLDCYVIPERNTDVLLKVQTTMTHVATIPRMDGSSETTEPFMEGCIMLHVIWSSTGDPEVYPCFRKIEDAINQPNEVIIAYAKLPAGTGYATLYRKLAGFTTPYYLRTYGGSNKYLRPMYPHDHSASSAFSPTKFIYGSLPGVKSTAVLLAAKYQTGTDIPSYTGVLVSEPTIDMQGQTVGQYYLLGFSQQSGALAIIASGSTLDNMINDSTQGIVNTASEFIPVGVVKWSGRTDSSIVYPLITDNMLQASRLIRALGIA